MLDALKDLKDIPDLEVKSAITIFEKQLNAYNEEGSDKLIGYALKYPPRVRALLGALLGHEKEGSCNKEVERQPEPAYGF